MKRNVLFRFFFCHSLILLYYCHVKAEKNIIILWSRKKKRRTQTANGNLQIDNVDEDKLSDTDERESFVKPQAKAARRNFHSIWLEKYKWLRHDNTKGMFVRFALSLAKQIPSLLAALISKLRH